MDVESLLPTTQRPKPTSPPASSQTPPPPPPPPTKTFGTSLLLSSLAVLLIYLHCLYDHNKAEEPTAALPPPTSTTTTITAGGHNDSDSDFRLSSLLHISLKQAASRKSSPPALTITVTNTSPSALTLLTWDSPLDPLALQLGLLVLTRTPPPDANNNNNTNNTNHASAPPLELAPPVKEVTRKLPPADECLVGLAPGESRENYVVLPREGMVMGGERQGAQVQVALKGRWTRVWLVGKAELTGEMVADAGGNAVSGEFETDGITIQVE